jgi:ketosteroid isomerase-like protein
MKNIFMTFLFASLNLLLFAQQKDSTRSEKDIKSIIQKQEEEWNKHDFEAFCKFYTDDATFINYMGMFWKGKREIVAHLNRRWCRNGNERLDQ